jgi:hypothetical protein
VTRAQTTFVQGDVEQEGFRTPVICTEVFLLYQKLGITGSTFSPKYSKIKSKNTAV